MKEEIARRHKAVTKKNIDGTASNGILSSKNFWFLFTITAALTALKSFYFNNIKLFGNEYHSESYMSIFPTLQSILGVGGQLAAGFTIDNFGLKSSKRCTCLLLFITVLCMYFGVASRLWFFVGVVAAYFAHSLIGAATGSTLSKVYGIDVHAKLQPVFSMCFHAGSLIQYFLEMGYERYGICAGSFVFMELIVSALILTEITAFETDKSIYTSERFMMSTRFSRRISSQFASFSDRWLNRRVSLK